MTKARKIKFFFRTISLFHHCSNKMPLALQSRLTKGPLKIIQMSENLSSFPQSHTLWALLKAFLFFFVKWYYIWDLGNMKAAESTREINHSGSSSLTTNTGVNGLQSCSVCPKTGQNCRQEASLYLEQGSTIHTTKALGLYISSSRQLYCRLYDRKRKE